MDERERHRSLADSPDRGAGNPRRTDLIRSADQLGRELRHARPRLRPSAGTGPYTFWIASDDNGELWLSSDTDPAHKTLIASVGSWTNSREWTKLASQQSVSVNLTAGQKYYIEALQKEGGGGDNLAVAWQGPGITRAVIEGQYLSPFVAPAAPGTGTGLWAEYYDNSDFTNLRLERVDASGNMGCRTVTVSK